MQAGGMTVVIGAVGSCAMTGVRGNEPVFDRMGQSGGGHAWQEERPSQEAHDHYAGNSLRPERERVHSPYGSPGRYAVSRSGAGRPAKALSLLHKRNTAEGETERILRRGTIAPISIVLLDVVSLDRCGHRDFRLWPE